MKVTGVKNHFKPIAITIESSKEAKAIRQAMQFWLDNYDESDYTLDEITILREFHAHTENIANENGIYEI